MSDSEKSSVSHLAIKIPTFDTTNIKMWFKLLETQFKLANIKSSTTQFHHLISNLPMTLLNNIPENIIDEEKYEDLKNQVLANYEKSKHEIFDEFINKIVLDSKPSVFLHEIENAAKKVGVSEDIVRRRFEKALPANISPVIAAQQSVPLHDLGKLADDLINLCPSSSYINQSSIKTDKDLKNYNKEKVMEDSKKYNKQIQPFHPNQRPKICRSHIYYGKAAKFCRFWCQWLDKSKCKVLDTRTKTPNNSPVKETTLK